MTTIEVAPPNYDEWVRLVFDHPISAGAEQGKEWYWSVDVEVSDPRRLLSHVMTMCLDLGRLAGVYTMPQINQGTWFLFGNCVSVGEFLARHDIDVDLRRRCIDAMAVPYLTLVPICEEPIENCFLMWWELLASAAGWDQESGGDPDDVKIRDEVLLTLASILRVQSGASQRCALHGLGHLQHQQRAQVIDEWLRRNQSQLGADTLQWILQCRDGSVM